MTVSEEKTVEILKPKSVLGIRHVQVIMLFFGMVILYAMRVNMSLAIVAMTDVDQEQYFDWPLSTQSVILSSFFWGYVILQVPAGELAKRFGGTILLIISVTANSLASLLVPTAAYYGGWKLVCACRVLQGLTQGFVYPSVHYLISKWAPLDEKSKLSTAVYAGSQLGTAIQYISSGFIANSWGWEAIFYVNGGAGVVWTILYIILGADSPQNSKMIGEAERNYIQTSLGHVGVQKKIPTPWSKIFTSIPFYALIIVHCGQNWGFWTLLTEMPSYMSYVLGVDIKANGVLSALPYLAMYVLSFPIGFISDYALKKQWCSITTARKLSNSFGLYLPAIALIGLSFAPAGNVAAAVALLTVVVALNAGHYAGFLVVHIDMAPNFSGTLMGITNMLSNFISIIAPLVAGVVIRDETDAQQWRNIFYISSAIYVITNTIFVIFGTSKTQSWNFPKENPKDEENAEKA